MSRLRVVEAFWMGLFSMAFDKIKTDYILSKRENWVGGGGALPAHFPLGVIIDTRVKPFTGLPKHIPQVLLLWNAPLVPSCVKRTVWPCFNVLDYGKR